MIRSSEQKQRIVRLRQRWVMRFISDALTADTSHADRRVATALPP
jgi:hypothetical protein